MKRKTLDAWFTYTLAFTGIILTICGAMLHDTIGTGEALFVMGLGFALLFVGYWMHKESKKVYELNFHDAFEPVDLPEYSADLAEQAQYMMDEFHLGNVTAEGLDAWARSEGYPNYMTLTSTLGK